VFQNEKLVVAMRRGILLPLAFGALIALSCKRETRNSRVDPPEAESLNNLRISALQPGPLQTNPPVQNPYEKNAYALSQGKQLYTEFNCVGCHAHGGGGMGPPLMDEKWIYGSNPEQIFATIVQGRPNGMPSFGGKIPDYQVWQLAAYVRSMSGLASKGAAPGRDDHISGKKPENSTETQKPTTANIPRSAAMPQ
jgi:cytochrome c oxidase cbb3-type subunit 3